MSQRYSIACWIDRSTNAWTSNNSRRWKSRRLQRFEDVWSFLINEDFSLSKSRRLAVWRWCCRITSILFFLSTLFRNRCFWSSNCSSFWRNEWFRSMQWEDASLNAIRKYTISSCWSSLQETLTKLFERSSIRNSCFHFKKSWSRHRVRCDEFEVVWYNFRMNIKNKNNSISHFDWMQKDENVRKKSSNFASLSKILQLRNAIVKVMLVAACKIFYNCEMQLWESCSSQHAKFFTIARCNCENHARRNMQDFYNCEMQLWESCSS